MSFTYVGTVFPGTHLCFWVDDKCSSDSLSDQLSTRCTCFIFKFNKIFFIFTGISWKFLSLEDWSFWRNSSLSLLLIFVISITLHLWRARDISFLWRRQPLCTIVAVRLVLQLVYGLMKFVHGAALMKIWLYKRCIKLYWLAVWKDMWCCS